MLVGIEAERSNHKQKTGVEHYAKQLILHLAKIDSINNYVLYLRTQPEDWLRNLPGNFKVKVMPFPIFWTQLRVSWELFFNSVDVLLIPASALPLIHPKKSVVTIHDIAWKFYPQTFTWFNRNFLELSTAFAIKSASNIIAVSEATKRDLVKFYNIDEKKITVIHHGYELDSKQQTADSRQLPEKFVLFLSTIQPRKNLQGLIEAFKLLKKDHPDLPHKLVVVGRLGWKYNGIMHILKSAGDEVIFLNHVSDSERLIVLKKAQALILPSFYEGFGMQILEAFAANVPVVCSNISSMPEVAGEAAVYFNPQKIEEIKEAIKNILYDQSLRQNLVEAGRLRLKSFSWEKCATETLEVLTK